MPDKPVALRLDERALDALDATGNLTRALGEALERIARGDVPDHRRPVHVQISARLPSDLVRRARAVSAEHGIALAEAVEAVVLGTAPHPARPGRERQGAQQGADGMFTRD
ncbi:hypothetical protein [Streptomyces sp. NPDC087294]|uniref:hypothetical protein n=1 Tax=Streptomyces sp. NPDC087294 TaxID=3365777 RepID=UPI0037F3A40E